MKDKLYYTGEHFGKFGVFKRVILWRRENRVSGWFFGNSYFSGIWATTILTNLNMHFFMYTPFLISTSNFQNSLAGAWIFENVLDLDLETFPSECHMGPPVILYVKYTGQLVISMYGCFLVSLMRAVLILLRGWCPQEKAFYVPLPSFPEWPQTLALETLFSNTGSGSRGWHRLARMKTICYLTLNLQRKLWKISGVVVW